MSLLNNEKQSNSWVRLRECFGSFVTSCKIQSARQREIHHCISEQNNWMKLITLFWWVSLNELDIWWPQTIPNKQNVGFDLATWQNSPKNLYVPNHVSPMSKPKTSLALPTTISLSSFLVMVFPYHSSSFLLNAFSSLLFCAAIMAFLTFFCLRNHSKDDTLLHIQLALNLSSS